MTCIVGLEHNGQVTIGGDSAGMAGWTLNVRADEKVFELGELVVGFTTSFRMGQAIRYRMKPPPIATNDLDRYMAVDFVDAVRACLKDSGFATMKDSQEAGGTFLIGVRGRLYRICDDYQVARNASGYSAVGCGEAIALGAFHATSGLTPAARVRAALKAAEAHSGGVRGPFVTLTTGANDD